VEVSTPKQLKRDWANTSTARGRLFKKTRGESQKKVVMCRYEKKESPKNVGYKKRTQTEQKVRRKNTKKNCGAKKAWKSGRGKIEHLRHGKNKKFTSGNL